MADCIKCNKDLGGKEGVTICPECAGKLADGMLPADLLATAQVGFDALIDEATGYEKIRPPRELSERHKRYKEATNGDIEQIREMVCSKCNQKITGIGSLTSKIVNGKLVHTKCPTIKKGQVY